MEVSGLLQTPSAVPQGKSPPCPLDRKLGESQSESRRCGEEKNLFPLARIEPQFIRGPARSLVPIPSAITAAYEQSVYSH
jgi:hypothetical protein